MDLSLFVLQQSLRDISRLARREQRPEYQETREDMTARMASTALDLIAELADLLREE